MEVTATLLALFIAFIGLVRFYSKKKQYLLVHRYRVSGGSIPGWLPYGCNLFLLCGIWHNYSTAEGLSSLYIEHIAEGSTGVPLIRHVGWWHQAL